MSANAPIATAIEELLQNLSHIGGVKQKLARIEEWVSDHPPHYTDQLKNVLKFAYDDFIRYGVDVSQEMPRLVDDNHTGVDRDFDARLWDLLVEIAAECGRGSREGKLDRLANGLGPYDPAVRRIIFDVLQKDLSCGINESTVNKAFKGLLTTFDVMLAKPFEGKKAPKYPVAAEPKYDGLRVVAVVRGQDVVFYTRSGRPLDNMDAFKSELIILAESASDDYDSGGIVFDGEVLAGDSFNESISAARSKSKQVGEDARFMVFDVLPLECLSGDKSWESEIYTQRRHILTEAFFALEKVCEGTDGTALRQVHMAPSYLASSEEEIWHLYENARNAGLEGLIVKNRAGRWVPKRSPDWMKIKNESTEDLPVIGYFEGEGQFAGSLGGLIVRYKDTDVKVGSGFTPAQRAAIWEAVRRDERRIEQGEDTEVLQQLCEVQFQEETEHGSLRHPVFVRMRLDKKEPAF